MDKVFNTSSIILAACGATLCLAAGVGRMLGMYYIAGFQSVTLFIGGIALMVMACYIKLQQPLAHTIKVQKNSKL